MTGPDFKSPTSASLSQEYQRDWPAYFDAAKGQAARATCVEALNALSREVRNSGLAVDVACGEGRDTREMLARGFSVIALDSSEDGLERLARSVKAEEHARLTLVRSTMEDAPERLASLCGSGVDFVNASFALPFCQPVQFPRLWSWIVGVIKPGGRFAGQFFGDRDEWRVIRPASHYSRMAALALLEKFELERFEEVEKDGSDAMGGTKHHHLYHVVARRRGDRLL